MRAGEERGGEGKGHVEVEADFFPPSLLVERVVVGFVLGPVVVVVSVGVDGVGLNRWKEGRHQG